MIIYQIDKCISVRQMNMHIYRIDRYMCIYQIDRHAYLPGR